MKHHIYVDNAATTRLDQEAFEAMIPWLTEDYANPSQPYSFSRSAKKAISDARATIAACINADPDEIFFTSGGTESDNWAIKGVANANPEKKRIITTPIEHHAVLNTCNALSLRGFDIDYVSVDENGFVNQADLSSKLNQAPASIVSIMMANNELGTIQPIEQKTAETVHRSGALFHTDAVQAVGHIAIDVKKAGIDLLSASAHKFNGPKGIGFLYIKKGTPILPNQNGGAQENGMRGGTENVASIVGMSVALKNNCANLEANSKHIKKLSQQLIHSLGESGVLYRVNGSGKDPFGLPGVLSISFPGFDGEAILHRLDLMGISVSTGAACDSKKTEISHVLKAIHLDEQLARGTIRISLGKYNTEEDVHWIVKALLQIVK